MPQRRVARQAPHPAHRVVDVRLGPHLLGFVRDFNARLQIEVAEIHTAAAVADEAGIPMPHVVKIVEVAGRQGGLVEADKVRQAQPEGCEHQAGRDWALKLPARAMVAERILRPRLGQRDRAGAPPRRRRGAAPEPGVIRVEAGCRWTAHR